MKESWPYFDYLRRCWKLMLLACVMGVLAGYLLDQPKVNASTYSARTTVAVSDPTCAFCTATDVEVTLGSGSRPSTAEATAALQEKLSRLSSYAKAPVKSGEFIVDHLSPRDWWKALVLGGVFALLLAIGLAYVWDDARAYLKHLEAQT